MSEKNSTKSKDSKESNGRGGARRGAGRKVGSATKRTREIADRASAEGITPLEYMLQLMHTVAPDDWEPKEKAAHQALRFEAAKAAAPYMHPRLAAIEHTGPDGGAIVVEITRFGQDKAA